MHLLIVILALLFLIAIGLCVFAFWPNNTQKLDTGDRPTENRTSITVSPLDLDAFNTAFVEANRALAQGHSNGNAASEALKRGISLLGESLLVSGKHAKAIASAINCLSCALSKHDRANTKGPWNWDLKGYGLLSWKTDIWDRDYALQRAWEHIAPVNDELRRQGLGWDFN